MFGLFKRNKRQESTISVNEKVATKIVRAVALVQQRWARYMERKSERLSIATKKKLVILFCLATGGYSIYLAGESLFQKQSSVMKVTFIKRPQYVTQTGDEKLSPSIIISEKEYAKIVQFRKYMDSLAATRSGKWKADSILVARPGLMDSINHLEQLYHLQTKK
ncbi:MAG: hypothetical protein J0I32_04675 [Sphingobacteriales bacterium]|nr:hypothetical protein [Sphingobacteriales bacterium]OJV98455.1 MAG: hypothetical protein BGO52_11750 [Sphingobacteriales bacterium 44-61]